MRPLTDDENALLQKCYRRLVGHSQYNDAMARWYDAKNEVRNLGISLPRRTSNDIKAIVGWPALVVDSLEERLDINGFVAPGVSDLSHVERVWTDNNLDVEYSQAHLEAMIHGVSFLTAQPGGDGIPSPAITVESPKTMTGIWDPVRRDLSAAAAFVFDDKRANPIRATLFTRELVLRITDMNGKPMVEEELRHNLGRVPVRRLVNRARTGRKWGASEITPSILASTASAIRTLVRSEIASEFFSAPQRIGLGLAEEDFAGADGANADKFRAYLGYMMLIPDDKTNPEYQRPEISQLAASSPQPFIDLVRMYSQLVAGEAALPPAYLGFETANPSSADQIRAIEARHVKRAERKQRIFGKAWAGIIRDALELTNINTTGLEGLAVNWADAATPTRAATADAIVKQVSAGILPATSAVTFEQLGYDQTTVKRLVADARTEQARSSASRLLMSTFEALGSDENAREV